MILQNRFTRGDHWRVESTLCFSGHVVARIPEAVNDRLDTGEVEVFADEMETLGEAKVIPFQIAKDEECNEALRLEYRFLDMRREKLHNNLILRSKVISRLRELMSAEGFMEMQTPILTSSSPEGAEIIWFLVASIRVNFMPFLRRHSSLSSYL